MKKRFKKKVNIKLVIAFVFGMVVTMVIGYSATIQFNSQDVHYNNTDSGLVSTNVKSAIDEIDSACESRKSQCPDSKKCFTDTFHTTFGDDYYKLKSITSTGAQYIDTGYVPDADTGYFIDFSTRSTDTSDLVIFGSYMSANVKVFFDQKYNSSNGMQVYGDMGTSVSSKITVGTDRVHAYLNYLDSSNLEVNQDRTDFSSGKSSLGNITRSIYLFAYHDSSASYKSKLTMVEFEITQDNEIVRRFTPCMRKSDMKPGMCEEFEGIFYPSATSTDFYPGPLSDDRGNEVFKVGDYVQMNSHYNCPTNIPNTYTGSTISSLCSGTNKKQLNLWRVISISDNNTIELVSEYTTNAITFNGTIGYRKYIDGLNFISGYFQNETYSRMARSAGYSGNVQTPVLEHNTSAWGSPNYYDSNYQKGQCIIQENGSTADYFESMNHIQQISYERQGIGDIGYTDDTTKINAVYGTISAPKHGTSTNTGYFLASRSYVYSSNTCKYNITNVTANGTIDRQQPYLITGNNTSITNASISSTVRPVITMYSYVIPFTGAGTKANPYIINRPSA